MEVFLFMRGTNIWNSGGNCHYSIRLSSHFHNRHLTYGSRICTQDMYFIIKPPLNLSVSNTITSLLLSNSAVQTPSAIIFPTITSAARSHLSLLRPISLDSSKPFRHLQYLGSLNIRCSSQWGPYTLILSCTASTPLHLQRYVSLQKTHKSPWRCPKHHLSGCKPATQPLRSSRNGLGDQFQRHEFRSISNSIIMALKRAFSHPVVQQARIVHF